MITGDDASRTWLHVDQSYSMDTVLCCVLRVVVSKRRTPEPGVFLWLLHFWRSLSDLFRWSAKPRGVV